MQASPKTCVISAVSPDALVHPGHCLINFGVSWSVLSRIQDSIIENVAKLFKDDIIVVNVDVEKLPEVKSRFDISTLPTVLILKDGKEIKRFEGIQSEKILAQELNRIAKTFDVDISSDSFWTSFKDKELEKELFQREILIIDDDPDITFCVRTILEEAKFTNIELSHDFKSTSEHLERSIPDLIFLNITMHNKEGHKIMAALRKNSAWSKIPILVSVGPLEPSRVYEDTFKNAAVLKHGKYVEWPKNRQTFILLVRHMLLFKERTKSKEPQKISFGAICPQTRPEH